MIFGKKLFIFFKNNFTRINHCKFLHHKSHLKPFLSYLPWIVRREHFSIIFNVKQCTLYLIKYGNKNISLVIANFWKNSNKHKCEFCFAWYFKWGYVTHQMAVPVPSISSCVLNHHNLFYQIHKAPAFNWDTCCHLALCLWLLPLPLAYTKVSFSITAKPDSG